MKLIAIDFETANTYPESACAVGISVFEDGIEIDSYYTLIKPLKKFGHFDWKNINIHHIEPYEVEDAPGFEEVYNYLSLYFYDSLFVAHNADFDMTVLRRCCLANHLEIPPIQYFCTVQLTRKIFPYMNHHRLSDCCDYMQIELDHHNAISDAQACAMIVLNCMILAETLEFEELIQKCNIQVKSLLGKT